MSTDCKELSLKIKESGMDVQQVCYICGESIIKGNLSISLKLNDLDDKGKSVTRQKYDTCKSVSNDLANNISGLDIVKKAIHKLKFNESKQIIKDIDAIKKKYRAVSKKSLKVPKRESDLDGATLYYFVNEATYLVLWMGNVGYALKEVADNLGNK